MLPRDGEMNFIIYTFLGPLCIYGRCMNNSSADTTRQHLPLVSGDAAVPKLCTPPWIGAEAREGVLAPTDRPAGRPSHPAAIGASTAGPGRAGLALRGSMDCRGSAVPRPSWLRHNIFPSLSLFLPFCQSCSPSIQLRQLLLLLLHDALIAWRRLVIQVARARYIDVSCGDKHNIRTATANYILCITSSFITCRLQTCSPAF